MRFNYLILCFSLLSYVCFSQGVGIGTTQVAPSAILELQSTSKGTLLTRMTSAQRNAIVDPETGLLVFDTDKHTLFMFDGRLWLPLMFATNPSNLPPFGVTAEDATIGDNFGYDVAISGMYAVIGAPDDKIGNNSVQGSAYVFQKTNGIWMQQTKLTGNDGASEDFFGTSVAIDGDYIVVGAPFKTVNGMESAGRVYVFFRNGDQWTQQANLQASDAQGGDHFGFDVSISNQYLVSGAPHNDFLTHFDRGCAYVFIRSGTIWSQQAVINPSAGLSGDNIGRCVDIDGQKILLGAPGDDQNGQADAGTAYLYKRFGGNTWSLEYQFLPQSVQQDAQFGRSVALDDTIAVIGCPYLDYLNYINLGYATVYFYNGSTWYKHAEITPQEAHEGLSFALSVDVHEGTVVIGTPNQNVGYHAYHGKAWVYRQNGNSWRLVREVQDGDGQSYANFGWAVAIDENDIVVGSHKKNNRTGEVFFINME